MPKCTWAEALPGETRGSTRANIRGARPTMTCLTRAGGEAPGAAGVQTAGPRLWTRGKLVSRKAIGPMVEKRMMRCFLE